MGRWGVGESRRGEEAAGAEGEREIGKGEMGSVRLEKREKVRGGEGERGAGEGERGERTSGPH